MSYYIAPMQLEDIPEVSRVEHQCFTNPWPQSAYRRELRNPANSAYIVLRYRPDRTEDADERGDSRGPLSLLPFKRMRDRNAPDQIVGFAGMWALYDEAHVTTIGVAAEHRGKGLGELLFVTLIEEAERRNSVWVTLEVRVSNDNAQALYRKYGFTEQGIRRRYYSDNGEDAYIMWSPSLHTDAYRQQWQHLRNSLGQRLSGLVIPNPDRDLGAEPRSRTVP